MRYPELENSDLAEFVGLMLGDGSIAKYECKTGDGSTNIQRCVKLTISSNEERFCDYLFGLFEQLFDVTPNYRKRKGENTVDIRTYRKQLFEFLTQDLGLKLAPKWDKAEIPPIYMCEEYRRDVLRGYFDTDGSVVLTDNNGTLYPRLEMKICPSPMQSQFEKILEQENFRFGSYDIGKGKVRIQMNGKNQLNKWMDKIGFKNAKHLEKAERVLD